jgi:hypothetical protein
MIVVIVNILFLIIVLLGIRMDYIRFYHLRSYDRINAPQRKMSL